MSFTNQCPWFCVGASVKLNMKLCMCAKYLTKLEARPYITSLKDHAIADI